MRRKVLISLMLIITILSLGTMAYAATCSQCGMTVVVSHSARNTGNGSQHALEWGECDNGHLNVYSWQDHSFSYTTLGGSGHRKTCGCGYSTTESHSGTRIRYNQTSTQHTPVFKCNSCPQEYTGNSSNHNWQTTSTVPATCTTDGTENQKCSVCDYPRTQTIPATGHTLGAWEFDSSEHWKECSVCGAEDSRDVHVDGNTDGLCDVCNYQMVDNSLITTWRIPVDADGSGLGTTIKLPIPSNSINNFIVDWGDGSALEQFGSSANFPTHTYTNTAQTDYTIKIGGTVHTFGYANMGTPSQSGSYSNYYTYCQYLVGVSQLGETSTRRYGFSNCKNLTSFAATITTNTFNYTDSMEYMFYSCTGLTTISADNWNASNVTTMRSMFNDCSNLTTLSLNNFDTSGVTTMYSMFQGCSKLTSLNVSSFDTSNVTDMTMMFRDCAKLTSLNINGFNTGNVTTMSSMFLDCYGLTSISLGSLNTESVKYMNLTFSGCIGLTSLDLSSWDTRKVTDMSQMFRGCSGLTSLNVSGFKPGVSSTATTVDLSQMFFGCTNLTSLNLTNFDTSKVTHMNSMFGGLNKITTLDVSSFRNNRVVNMSSMFSCCFVLQNLNLTSFGTSNVTNMSYMFDRCNAIRNLDLSSFDTSRVTNMNYMFNECSQLVTLDLSNFNTSALSSMNSMFYKASNLKTLILGPNFTRYDGISMFTYTSKLERVISLYNGVMTLPTTGSNQLGFSIGVLYVKTKALEDLYESDTNFSHAFSSASGVRPFLELAGTTPASVSVGDTYVDDGATVAGLAMNSGANITPTMFQSAPFNYTLTYDDSHLSTSAPVTNSDLDNPTNYVQYNLSEGGTTFATIKRAVDVERSINNATALITTWRIPVDADGSGLGTTIKLPIQSNSNNDYLVDWGDGSAIESFGSSASFPTHTYTNTAQTDYTITVDGVVYSWGYAGESEPTVNNSLSDYYTYCQYLVGVSQFGDTSTRRYAFSFCKNLTSFTAVPTATTFTYVTNMQDMFFGCNGLTAIPVDSWNTSAVTNMTAMFHGCTGLTSLSVGSWNTGAVTGMSHLFYNCNGLTSIPVGNWNTSSVTNMSGMFGECSGITSIDLSSWNTGNTTNMSSMFLNCTGLTSINVSGFKPGVDTSASTVSLSNMFKGCQTVTSIDLTNFNTSKVTNMSAMFRLYKSYSTGPSTYGSVLTTLDLSSFNTSNVTDMSYMFYSDGALQTVDVSSFDTSNVTNMAYMFGNCRRLTKLDLSNFDTSSVNNMDYMFQSLANCTDIILGEDFDRITGSNMFVNGSTSRRIISLRDSVMTLPTSGNGTTGYLSFTNGTMYVKTKTLENSYETNTNFANAFGTGATAVNKVEPLLKLLGDDPVAIDLDSSYEDDGVTVAGLSMESGVNITPTMFQSAPFNYTLTYDTSHLRTNAPIVNDEDNPTNYIVYNLADSGDTIFASVRRAVNVNNSAYVDPETALIMNFTVSAEQTLKLPIPSNSNNDVTIDWGDRTVQSLGNTANFPAHTFAEAGTYMVKVGGTVNSFGYYYDDMPTSNNTYSDYYSFCQCLTSVARLGNLGYSRVGFSYCENMTSFSAITEDCISNITNLSYLFYGCSSLTTLNFQEFDTSAVINMDHMFEKCRALTTLNLVELDTGSCEGFGFMFCDCDDLTTLNISSFDTSSATNMGDMFNGCSSLTSIDVTGFNTSDVVSFSCMFNGCSSLTSIDVSNFDSSQVCIMDSMFEGCSGLTYLNLASFNTSSLYSSGSLTSMFQDCSSLETLLLGASFTRINGEDMFYGDSSLKAIITLRESPMTCSTNNSLSGLTNAILYVPTAASEASYEAAPYYSTAFAKAGSDDGTDLYRVRPILEVNGNPTYTLDVGNSYTASMDAGALVAGYSNKTQSNADVFTKYGFSVSNSSLPIYRETAGSETLTYSLSRNSGGTPQSMMTATRTIVYEEVDIIPPTGTITFTNPLTALDGSKGTKNMTVTLIINGTDNSGVVDKMAIMNEDVYATIKNLTGSALTTALSSHWENYATTKANWQLTAGDGRKTVYLILKDAAGNMSPVTSVSLNPGGGVNTAQYLPGPEFNLAIKQATGQEEYGYEYSTKDQDDYYITAIEWQSSRPANMDAIIADPYTKNVGVNTSLPIYAWFDYDEVADDGTGTIKLWSEATSISLNPDSSWMFERLTELQELDVLDDLHVTEGTSNVTNMEGMFEGYLAIQSIDLTGLDTSSVTNMSYMFAGNGEMYAYGLLSLDLSMFDTSNVTDMSGMFQRANSVESIDLSSFDTSSVTNMNRMFDGCCALTDLDVSGFNTSNVEDMSNMFSACISLETIDVSGFDTGNVTTMSYMFSQCNNLTSLDVSGFDTPNVEYMDSMFNACENLATIDVSEFDTANVASFGGMFGGCSSVASLDVSGFDTSNATHMFAMFRNCSSLTSLDLSSFNTSNVTDGGFAEMFKGCTGLTSIDVTRFDVSNASEMQEMFRGCTGLTSLDLRNFNTANVTNMQSMFYGCSSLVRIYASSNFVTTQITTYNNSKWMFYGCLAINGGSGTTYNGSHVDKAYAHIDGGTSNPGYFTANP